MRTRSIRTGSGYQSSVSSRAFAWRSAASKLRSATQRRRENGNEASVLGLEPGVLVEARTRRTIDDALLVGLDLADARCERRRERLLERLAELGADVALLQEDRRRSLAVSARREQDERGIDPVEVVKRVQRELECLTAKQLAPRGGRLSLRDRAAGPESTQVVLDRGVAVDRLDVARVGAPSRRVRTNGECPDGQEVRSVDGSDGRALVGDLGEPVTGREPIPLAHVVGDLGSTLSGRSGRLPRRPGGGRGRAPAAGQHQQRTYSGARDDCEDDVEDPEAAAIREAAGALAARLLALGDGRSATVRRHRLGVGGSLAHHIVGHELSSERSTSGIAILDSSSRFRSSSPNSSRRAFSTSAMCSTASRLWRPRLYAAT